MTDTAISPLRQRMIEDMKIRGFAEKTQMGYLRAVGAGRGRDGGSAALSVAYEIQRGVGNEHERGGFGPDPSSSPPLCRTRWRHIT